MIHDYIRVIIKIIHSIGIQCEHFEVFGVGHTDFEFLQEYSNCTVLFYYEFIEIM